MKLNETANLNWNGNDYHMPLFNPNQCNFQQVLCMHIENE